MSTKLRSIKTDVEEKDERILERIAKWEDAYFRIKDKSSMAYLELLNSMRNDYEINEDYDKCKAACEDIEYFAIHDKSGNTRVSEILLASYDTRARLGDFRAYCIALEWNRPIEKQYFLPRRRIMEKHGLIQAFQDVIDDKLDFLFVSQPPRTAKSTTGIFFMTFLCALYPDGSILANGHSTALTQSFYNEMLNIMTGEEYRYNAIFPNNKITSKSAEYSWLDVNSDKRFHTFMAKSIDGGTTGLAEASVLLYCDDLIKDIETAENPTRLDKIFATYTSTIQDRKVNKLCKDGIYRPCPEVHIATRWSINDVIGRLIRIYGEVDSERIRIINIPCYDENGESNFMYDYGKGFDKNYYHHLELTEDPITFAAKYLGQPMERTGHPFSKDNLTFYTELPSERPDRIVCCADPSWGGKDYFSAPIGYVYGNEVYIEDVYYQNNVDIDISRQHLLDKIIKHKATKLAIEKNNGGLQYSELLANDCRKRNYRLNITTHNAPTNKSKRDRIMSCRSEIQGIAVNESTYKIYFKADSLRENNREYNNFMRDIYNWSEADGSIQKTQKDDCVDSLASMIINILGGKTVGRASSKFSLDKYGL